MRRHAFTAVQDLDAAGGGPRLDLLMNQRLRNAVEVLVVIDIDAPS
jgi:hypothetical protein